MLPHRGREISGGSERCIKRNKGKWWSGQNAGLEQPHGRTLTLCTCEDYFLFHRCCSTAERCLPESDHSCISVFVRLVLRSQSMSPRGGGKPVNSDPAGVSASGSLFLFIRFYSFIFCRISPSPSLSPLCYCEPISATLNTERLSITGRGASCRCCSGAAFERLGANQSQVTRQGKASGAARGRR